MREGKRKFHWSCALACVALGYVCGALPARAEDAAALHYSQATELVLRETPDAGAAALARLPLNQPVILLARENRWCRVRLAEAAPDIATRADAGREGYVHCAFLREERLDFPEIENEAARLFLELNRPALAPADEARILERLFTLIERHFALSPSLYAYHDYRALLREARRRGAENPEFQLSAREKKRAAMWRELSRQTWEREFPVVRRTVVTSRLSEWGKLRKEWASGMEWVYHNLPEYRPPGENTAMADLLPPPPKASFFSQGKWAIGWAGGPTILRRHGSHPPAYVAGGSNGGNEFLFDDLYEMVKALKAPVHVGLVMASPIWAPGEEGNAEKWEVPVLETKLPVWAITAEGIVAGELRKADFVSDGIRSDDSACSSSASAEIVFERPLKGRIYGVFASNAPIDPNAVKITTGNQTSLTGQELGAESARMTYREEASVDIDGDGVADLRALLSTDQSANLGRDRLHHAVFNGDPGGFLRVSGYYDANVYSLQVNEDGQWRTLFLYDLVTCT